MGLSGVIAHGMLTNGHRRAAGERLGGRSGCNRGLPDSLHQPVPVPDAPGGDNPDTPTNTLTITGKVGAVDEDARTARIDLTVTADDGEGRQQKVLMKTQAVVKFA